MKTMPNRECARSWIAVCLLSGLAMSGCGYGTATPHGYEFAKALHSICNQKDASRLQEFAEVLEADAQDGEISDEEANWFRDIIAHARSGDWAAANAASRELLQNQVQEH